MLFALISIVGFMIGATLFLERERRMTLKWAENERKREAAEQKAKLKIDEAGRAMQSNREAVLKSLRNPYRKEAEVFREFKKKNI